MERHRFYYIHLAYSLERTRTQTQISYLWSENSASIFPQPYFSNDSNHIRVNSLRVYKDELRPCPTTFQKNIFQCFFLINISMNTSCKAELINTHVLTRQFSSFVVGSWAIKSRDVKIKKQNSKTFYDNHTREPVTQRKVIIRRIRKYSQP